MVEHVLTGFKQGGSSVWRCSCGQFDVLDTEVDGARLASEHLVKAYDREKWEHALMRIAQEGVTFAAKNGAGNWKVRAQDMASLLSVEVSVRMASPIDDILRPLGAGVEDTADTLAGLRTEVAEYRDMAADLLSQVTAITTRAREAEEERELLIAGRRLHLEHLAAHGHLICHTGSKTWTFEDISNGTTWSGSGPLATFLAALEPTLDVNACRYLKATDDQRDSDAALGAMVRTMDKGIQLHRSPFGSPWNCSFYQHDFMRSDSCVIPGQTPEEALNKINAQVTAFRRKIAEGLESPTE